VSRPGAAPGRRVPPGRLGSFGVLALVVAACGPTAPVPAGPEPDSVEPLPVGRRAVERLEFERLDFEPPSPERFQLSNGIPVFYLHDPSLPLVDFIAEAKGGYGYFPRERYAAASALASLLRTGGTERLAPDSVDEIIEHYALGVTTASSGGRYLVAVNTLRRNIDVAIELWSGMLRRPRFDAEQVEIWRGRELEAARRIQDFPGSLAVMQFNRLMFDDHPTGWVMGPSDLTPDKVTPERLLETHARVFCSGHVVLGVAGDLPREEARAMLESAFGDWAGCPGPLTEPDPPDIREGPHVFVIPKELPQSTIVMGHAGGVLLEDDEEYYASRIANWILGGGGFNSRLVQRVRTDEGLAYTAASVWGASRRHERIFGAVTHTRSERTVEAIRIVLETIRGLRREPPGEDEVRLARDNIMNGFVFGFASPAQVVARQMGLALDEFPDDWLERYLRGIQRVSPSDVQRVMRRNVRPSSLVILIVGDPEAFDEPPDVLGPVTYLPPTGAWGR